ncbi:GroES-like protein [Annulohypoxylon maeteangense]|uniref:GroES-like protein n=1 Tax=Annulohypoxylon maeteangense TaxID=1927788 RepID=UPI002008AF22|nr:GroES-like protein [Annulohypoxylon maeteangense]KAI0882378.1 GroES-like protein [Annulohypoxylon maeteangense]
MYIDHIVFNYLTIKSFYIPLRLYLRIPIAQSCPSTIIMATHYAAVAVGKALPLEVRKRKTPKPGPAELLVEVKSVALNPIDCKTHNLGFALAGYPAVFGSDVGGVVVQAGSDVSDVFKPGTRVTAFAPSYFVQGAPDYGAFQQRSIIPAANACTIPDHISFNEAATFPMAVATAWSGLETLGVSRDASYSGSDKQGILVWGGSSSVGSMTVQVARSLGFTVYATASAKHHEYIMSLGASRVFDYKAPDVEDAVIKAAKEDGLTFQYGYDAVGALLPCHNILKLMKGDGIAHLASAPPLKPGDPTGEGVEVKFVATSTDEKERAGQFSFWFNIWLKEKLEKGEIVSCPQEIQLVDGGLQGINQGLGILKAGVSCTKLVIEI